MSMDLRERPMATLEKGASLRQVAAALDVAPSSLVKWSYRLRALAIGRLSRPHRRCDHRPIGQRVIACCPNPSQSTQQRRRIMTGYVAIVFDGKRTAGKALDTLEEAATPYLWVDDVAVVRKNRLGGIHVDSTWAQADSGTTVSAGMGALTGGLIGLLFGPGGALAGATMTGALGGLVGAAANASVSDPRLDEFAKALTKNSSALVLVGEEDALDALAGAPLPDGGKVIRSDLTSDDLRAIKRFLKQEA
jgi:uncharacterized membrane protein